MMKKSFNQGLVDKLVSRDDTLSRLENDNARLRAALRFTLGVYARLGDKAGWRHSTPREELVTIIEQMRDEARKGFLTTDPNSSPCGFHPAT